MDYQSNSHKKAEEEAAKEAKVVEKVVTGDVVVKKRSLGRKFKDIFFGGDAKGVTRYIAADVLLPAVRNLIVDASTKGIERLIYGDSSVRRRSPEYRPRVQYNNPINRRPDPRDVAYLPGQPPVMRQRRDIEDIVMVSREEAEMVLENMINIADKYDVVSVADLYDLVGLPTSHTDNKWGWSRLNDVVIRQVREGYLLMLPPVEAI